MTIALVCARFLNLGIEKAAGQPSRVRHCALSHVVLRPKNHDAPNGAYLCGLKTGVQQAHVLGNPQGSLILFHLGFMTCLSPKACALRKNNFHIPHKTVTLFRRLKGFTRSLTSLPTHNTISCNLITLQDKLYANIMDTVFDAPCKWAHEKGNGQFSNYLYNNVIVPNCQSAFQNL